LERKEMAQAFVNGAVDDYKLPLMLDTGANISLLDTNLARRLGVEVQRFENGSQLEHARTAFDMLKDKLSQAPMLRHLDRKRELVILLYTNDWAFGAAVCQ
jgi:hypothetical protein